MIQRLAVVDRTGKWRRPPAGFAAQARARSQARRGRPRRLLCTAPMWICREERLSRRPREPARPSAPPWARLWPRTPVCGGRLRMSSGPSSIAKAASLPYLLGQPGGSQLRRSEPATRPRRASLRAAARSPPVSTGQPNPPPPPVAGCSR